MLRRCLALRILSFRSLISILIFLHPFTSRCTPFCSESEGTQYYSRPLEEHFNRYYSSTNSVYYKFEDGKYVPLEFNEPNESDTHHYQGSSSKHTVEDESCYHQGPDGCENSLVI
ncbi:hypothetical protein SAY87_008267 [Trapa incisa]|uniref:Uncharacterized protein n=1 Tax=Trapa incisa TaxID=236973 RepID=A0AAN7QJ81_9MYRT|nr:hypothetical protein SAY87_008267 [Trapa incisa]